MKKYLMFALALLIMQTAYGQDREKMHEKIQAKKIAFITEELQLTPEESQGFWPVYNQYQEQMRAIRKDMKPPRKMKEMSDEEAKTMIDKFLIMQSTELDLQKKLYADLNGIISARKMVKLHHAERKFRERLLDRMKKSKEKRKR